jgi:glycosyltransferase involved in cell wall biosynthesis
VTDSDTSLRICLAAPHLAPYTKTNGIAWYNRWLAEGLAKRGHRVTVLDVSSASHEPRVEPWERTVVMDRTPRTAFPQSLRSALFVRNFISSATRFDILETSNWPGLTALCPVHTVGATIVRLITPSSTATFARPQNMVCNILETISVHRADATIASTDYIERSLGTLYRKDLTSSYRVPFGVPDVPVATSSIPTGPIRFLSIGRAEHRKGSDVLLGALVRAFANRTDFVVTLAGSYAAFAQTTPALGRLWTWLTTKYGDRLNVVEDLDEVRKLELLAASDYLLMTSRTESFGLPVIEAMRAATAVISSAGGGLREVAVASSGNILYDDPESEELLADAILAAVSAGRNEAAERGRKGRQVFEATFNESAFLDRTIDAYRDVLQRKSFAASRR